MDASATPRLTDRLNIRQNRPSLPVAQLPLGPIRSLESACASVRRSGGREARGGCSLAPTPRTATPLGVRLQTRRAPRAAAKVTLEVPDQVTPHPAFNPQPGQNPSGLGGDLAAAVVPSLATRPVQQLEILFDAHPQKPLVAGSNPRSTRLWPGLSSLVQLQGSEPTIAWYPTPLGSPGSNRPAAVGPPGRTTLQPFSRLLASQRNQLSSRRVQLLALDPADPIIRRSVQTLLRSRRHAARIGFKSTYSEQANNPASSAIR